MSYLLTCVKSTLMSWPNPVISPPNRGRVGRAGCCSTFRTALSLFGAHTMSSELPYRIYGSQMYHVRVPVCVKSCETCRWAKRAFDQDGSQRGRYKRGQISIVSLEKSFSSSWRNGSSNKSWPTHRRLKKDRTKEKFRQRFGCLSRHRTDAIAGDQGPG